MRRVGPRKQGFDAEWREINLVDGRRRPDQPLRDVRRGRPRRRTREIRRTQPAGTAAGKRGKPSVRALRGVLRGPRLGRHGRDVGRRHLQRRSSSGGECRRPARSGCRDRRTCGRSPTSGSQNMTSTVIATRGERLVLSRVRFSGATSDPRRSAPSCSTSSRSTPTTGSRRSSCSTPTTSTRPSRNSTPDTSPAKRPPTRTRGQSSRRPTPRSTGTSFPRRRRIG